MLCWILGWINILQNISLDQNFKKKSSFLNQHGFKYNFFEMTLEKVELIYGQTWKVEVPSIQAGI